MIIYSSNRLQKLDKNSSSKIKRLKVKEKDNKTSDGYEIKTGGNIVFGVIPHKEISNKEWQKCLKKIDQITCSNNLYKIDNGNTINKKKHKKTLTVIGSENTRS
ncbi:MAG: hypothetical protein ACPKPY_05480 [Nitrososphaeraceae archaeon]